jgi:fatty acid desaturase
MRAVCAPTHSSKHIAVDPHEERAEMARRLPAAVQPFLTWLTALPAPGDDYRQRTPMHHIAAAFAWLVAGTALSAAAVARGAGFFALLPFGMVATTAGMGLLQAVIYHHCAHGTVLATRRANRALGKFITLILLIKDFDAYQRDHIGHHNPKKLLEDGDEFVDYLRRFIGIVPGMPRRQSWRRVIGSFFSPVFHARFLAARLSACLAAGSTADRAMRLGFWASVLVMSHALGVLVSVLVVWFVPAALLFQIATSLRVLAEHRFPEPEIMALRDRGFIARATAGVFPGAPVPRGAAGGLAWTIWWWRMLTAHLFARIFVLVGDAPAHDYHHRRPGSRDWPSHIDARARDRALGSPGFPVNYIGNLGLFAAIDANLASIANARLVPERVAHAPPERLRHAA